MAPGFKFRPVREQNTFFLMTVWEQNAVVANKITNNIWEFFVHTLNNRVLVPIKVYPHAQRNENTQCSHTEVNVVQT